MTRAVCDNPSRHPARGTGPRATGANVARPPVGRVLLTVLLLALLAGAARADVSSPDFDVQFLLDGAVLKFHRPQLVQRIVLYDCSETGSLRPLLVEGLPDRPVSHHRLFFPAQWQRYRFEIVLRSGKTLFSIQTAPLDWFSQTNLTLQAPYTGEADVTARWAPQPWTRTVLVTPGAELSAEVEVISSPNRGGAIGLGLGGGVETSGDLAGWKKRRESDGNAMLVREYPVGTPGEIFRFSIPIRVCPGEGQKPVIVAVISMITPPMDFGGFDVVTHTRFVVAPLGEIAKTVRASEPLMPTDPDGNLDVRRPRDTVVLPSRAVLALRRWIGISGDYVDYYAPVMYQSVVFENTGASPIPLAVSARVTQLDDNAPAAGFRAPDYVVGPDGTYTTTAELAPGAKTPVVLPVYARSDVLLPGRYRSVVEARILGADVLVARVERLIDVRSPDVRALVVTALAALVSVAGLVVFLAAQRRIFKSFRVSELVLAALFATMTLALAVFPGSVLGPVFSAVAGPFAFLFQGIFFEAVRILVLVTLVVLVPRPGTVTLVSLVRYLLGGLVFGGFSPVDLLYFGSSVTLMEGALYFGGVTGSRGVLSRREIGFGAVLYVALVVGLVNAGVQYATYCLNITLYRLYFAGWFIALAVGVNGFLYAVLGALPGLTLGRRLRRISE